MKYIVIELQKNNDGSVGNLVYAFNKKAEAESKYYAILSAAAVSSVPVHSAIIIQEDAVPVTFKSFSHEAQMAVGVEE
jgi:hypothetical protein